MSGVTLHIDVDDRRIQDALTRLIETGQNLEPIMEDIATYGENSTRDRFRTETAPDGSKWRPNQRGGKILKQQMHLLDSITRDSGDNFAEWGSDTSVIYAAIHQFGGVIRPKNKPYLTFKVPGGGFRRVKQVTIPARPFVGINADDEANILDIITNNIAQAIG